MTSGTFAMYAQDVFLNGTTTIRYYGDEDMAGRALSRFDFRIPKVWSGYELRANGTSAKVGTTGSFWIDPGSLGLVRLEVRADEIPPAVGIRRTLTSIDYARMRIGESDVLLAQEAEILMVLLSGEVRRNTIEFSHCHEYRTASSIRFDLPDAPVAVSASPARRVDLPAGLTVTIELDSAIDSATAHVGDLLRGHLTDDVRRKGQAIIVPRGAIVMGRVRGLEALHSPETAFDLTIEVAEIRWEDTIAEFYGELLAAASGRGTHTPGVPGTGVLHMKGTRFQIAPGFRMSWRTLEPNRRTKSK